MKSTIIRKDLTVRPNVYSPYCFKHVSALPPSIVQLVLQVVRYSPRRHINSWSLLVKKSYIMLLKRKGWMVLKTTLKSYCVFWWRRHLKNNCCQVAKLARCFESVEGKSQMPQTCFMFFLCVQIHWLWKHLHETQWQSGFTYSFKLPVRLPYQQTEGQHFSVAFYLCLIFYKLRPDIKLQVFFY